jgi:hypothetical protein
MIDFLVETLKSLGTEKLGAILLTIVGALLWKKQKKHYSALYKLIKDKHSSVATKREYKIFKAFIIGLILAVTMITFAVKPVMYHEVVKAGRGLFTVVTGNAYYMAIFVLLMTYLAMTPVVAKVMTSKFPEYYTEKKAVGTIDTHAEEILNDFEQNRIDFNQYMAYKKLNKVQDWQREKDVMYKKFRVDTNDMKKFNKYLNLEKDLRAGL